MSTEYIAHCCFAIRVYGHINNTITVQKDYVDVGDTFKQASEALYDLYDRGLLIGYSLFNQNELVSKWSAEYEDPFPLDGTDEGV